MTGTNKAYDGSRTATVSLYSNDVVNGDSVTFAMSLAQFATKNVGAAQNISVTGLALSGPDARNYALQNTSATTSADITAKTITASFTAADKIYDGMVTATATGSSAGIVANDNVIVSATGAVFADRNVGLVKTVAVSGITLSGTDAGNYVLSSTTASATANINAKPLTVTVSASGKVYDGLLSTGATAASRDIFGSDAVVISIGAANFTDRHVGTGKLVIVNGIALSGADAGNYQLQNSTATTSAAITARSVTASFTVAAKTYDGTMAAVVAGSATGFISGDDVRVVTSSALFVDQNVGLSKQINISGISLAGSSAGDYVPSATTAQVQGNISAKSLAPAFVATSKLYDGNTSVQVADVTRGIAAGDNLSVLYTSAAFLDTAGGFGKPVLVSGLSLSGAAASNYVLAAMTALTSADIRMPAVPAFAFSELLHRTLHAETAIETTANVFSFADQKVSTAPIIKCSDQRALSQACGF